LTFRTVEDRGSHVLLGSRT